MVPDSVERLARDYDRLIVWTIRRSAWMLGPQEREDLRQMVYLIILERRFLERCQAYYATASGRFSSALATLVLNVVRDYRRSVRRDRIASAVALTPSHAVSSGREVERRLEAVDRLRKMGRALHRPGRSVQVADVVEAALQAGTTCSTTLAAQLGIHDSGVRARLLEARRYLAAEG